MGLETDFNYIDDLEPANPVGATDNVDEGDNHLRGIKQAVKGSFPSLGQGAVTKTAAEINELLSPTEISDAFAPFTVTHSTAGATGEQSTDYSHGLGTDDIEMSVMLDLSNISATEETAIVASVINSQGESCASVGRALTPLLTSADIPASGQVRIKINTSVAKVLTFRIVCRKR